MKNSLMGILAPCLVALLLVLLVAATGCSSSGTKGLTSVSVTPANPVIAVGGTQQFSAKGTYGGGNTQDITDSVVWTSSNSAVATIATNGGMATGVAPGTATIAATSGPVTSSPATLTVKVTPTLTSIAIQPPAPDVAIGNTQQLSAWGSYNDGTIQNITESVAWSSSVATVATISADGTATGHFAGTTTITAADEGISNIATLTVYYQVSAIVIAPPSQALAPSTGTTSTPFIVTGITGGGQVDISSGATLTVYLNGVATTDVVCTYIPSGSDGPGQYCTGDGNESVGTYQVVASYTGTTLTATATLTVAN